MVSSAASTPKLGFGALVGLSGVVHAGLLAVWAVTYRAPDPVAATGARSVSAVRMVQQGRPPPPKPKPRPESEPDPEPEPPPEEPTPVDPVPTTRTPGPPPPPPKQCRGCAMLPANAQPSPSSRASTSAIPVGVPGGVPGGVIGGVPGGVVGGTLGGQLGGTLGASAVPNATKREPAVEPLSAVMARAVYTPDPDIDQLARTSTGLMRRGSGVNKTGFCVDTNGKTVDVTTHKRYPGDPAVDRICRDTVATWRFKPFLVGGKPTKVCSTVRFDIRFER